MVGTPATPALYAALVQKRLVQLLNDRNEVITDNSGGRPVRLVVEEVSRGGLQLTGPDGAEITPEPEQESAESGG